MVGLLLLAQLTGPAPASAQGRGEPFFTRSDLLWAGGFAAATVALIPLDGELAGAARVPALQESRLARPGARALALVGYPGSLVVTGGMYLLGRAADRPVLADMGLHAGTAIVFGEAVTLAGKALAGRARPRVSPDDPYDFGFGRGFGSDDYQSFPSGHSTAVFALASALTVEVGERWPDARLPAGGAMYGAATLVALSRMYHDLHWASDVTLGAAIGTFAGWKVVEYVHDHPENRFDRVFLGISLEPGAGGRVARLWVAPGF